MGVFLPPGVAEAANYLDTQPPGSHLDPQCNINEYNKNKLLAYWTQVYTIGAIAGLVGTDKEQADAREAVKTALGDLVEDASSWAKAADHIIDDNPLVGTVNPVANSRYAGSYLVHKFIEFDHWVTSQFGVEQHFNTESRVNASAKNLSEAERLRDDALEMDTYQRAYVQEGVGLGNERTRADMLRTAPTVNRHLKETSDPFIKFWNSIQSAAKKRYQQFLDERNRCGVGYALQTIDADASFFVAEIAVSVAAGFATAGAGSVILRLSISFTKGVGGKVTKIMVGISRKGRVPSRGNSNDGQIDLNPDNVINHAKEHDGFSDDLGGTPAKQADRDAGGPDSERKDDGEEHDHRSKDGKTLSKADRKKLEDKQNQSIKDTMAIGKQKRGPVHTSVIDPETGNVYPGINGGVPPDARRSNILPNDLHPVLRDKIDQYNQGIKNGTIPTPKTFDNGVSVNGKPGHHSEIWALNQALNARKAAGLPVDENTLKNMFLSNKRISGRKSGQSIIRCPDCRNITDGVHDVSDKINFRD
jgi:hypothetical protein